MAQDSELSAEDARDLERVIGTGKPQSVGSFRFWFADQRWEWSEEVAAMHGYVPGTVEPTTELLLKHKHPDDREQVATTIARSIERAEPFCSRHRIIDTAGEVHHVIVVGDYLVGGDETVVGSTGYYIDVTDTLAEHRQETLSDALPELYEARAVIEQAKGALMLVYGISADQAFRVLTWRSQETNTKLRTLAQQLVTEITALGGWSVELRTRFDHLLLTVHQRAAAD
ncbi:PAS and ANTAR domain-containing protein [Nocardia sp. CDC159]|uniref:histidine kinase n=1 Tax=Nocardia pulmonis TaxID=2951408 RepID=A0A9X2E1J0_9NOCA|nr:MULTISPECIES: PAS and ANTAR domain-containing protein [Nocardia]MCM6772129.1 PAS and ANTAR domain-containing protein [Nocardia pulmonis]MCM6785213.1 PAS and ANTAR domain-containing protein [Nocardia sp. CDC159]